MTEPGTPPREQAEEGAFEAIEPLIERLQKLGHPAALAIAQDLLRNVLEVHRAGLAKIVELAPPDLRESLANDPHVATLLLLHDLHPHSLEERVRTGLAKLALTGWVVDVSEVDGGRVRIHTTRTSDPRKVATGDRVRALVERAALEAAPDATEVVVTGDVLEDGRGGFVPLSRLADRGPLVGGGGP